MLKEGGIFLLWAIALFFGLCLLGGAIESPIVFILVSVLLLGIWKSRWQATIHNELFLLLGGGFLMFVLSNDYLWILGGANVWCAGISLILIFYNGVFLLDRKIVIPKNFAYWLMWGVSLAFFGYSYFVADASFATFFLYALPCALVERRRSIIYFSNIWTLVILVVAPIILWKTSGLIHDSFYFDRHNEIFFGALGDMLNRNLWLRSLFLLPWLLMIWVHTKNTILNKNILHGRKLQK